MEDCATHSIVCMCAFYIYLSLVITLKRTLGKKHKLQRRTIVFFLYKQFDIYSGILVTKN
jgi:hypothetical protein